MTPPLTHQALHSQLATLLADQDAEGLRSLLHTMADGYHPRERAAFLEQVRDALGGESSHGDSDGRPSDRAVDLDTALQGLRRAIEAAKREAETNPPFPEEEDDALGPFGDVIPLVDSTLERIGNELEHGRTAAARAGYEQVWALIDDEDEFGRAPRLEDEEPERAREHAARYLRSVYLAAAPDERPTALGETAERVRFSGFPRQPQTLYITLREIAEAGRATLPAWESTLRQLLAVLEARFDPLGDLWLREATQACHGVEGLAALADRDGTQRPLAWLDAVGMAIQHGDATRAIAIDRATAERFPPRAPIRAELADLVVPAAAEADEGLLARLRYDALLADPTTDRLLALWQALDNTDDRMAWLAEAAEHLTTSGPEGDDPQRPPRGAYPRAASAVAACHETACARGQPRVGEQLVERMRSQYPRHSAFQRALREALGGVASVHAPSQEGGGKFVMERRESRAGFPCPRDSRTLQEMKPYARGP